MEDERVKTSWRAHWEQNSSVEDDASFVGVWLRHRRLAILRDILCHMNMNMSVIDLGCGGGTTLALIRDIGFKNSIGIDYIQQSINWCKEYGFIPGEDVFLMDAGNTTFSDKHFDIVFSEGLWEHFQNPERYMLEAIRIARKYIIIVQPNHFSLFGRLMFIGWRLLGRGGVKEYSFRLSYFIGFLEKNGFCLIQKRSTPLGEQAILVFRRSAL